MATRAVRWTLLTFQSFTLSAFEIVIEIDTFEIVIEIDTFEIVIEIDTFDSQWNFVC